jgi:hypothetical protein
MLAGVLCGCSAPPEGVWVARSQDLWVGVTVEGDRAAAFVCGGGPNLTTHTRWMTAAVDDDRVVFNQDGWTLGVDRAEDSAPIELTDPGGASVALSGVRPPDDGFAGLYTAMNSGCRTGVIIADGSASLGAWCDDVGNFAQVTPVQPLRFEGNGLPVTVDAPSGTITFSVERAVAAAITP